MENNNINRMYEKVLDQLYMNTVERKIIWSIVNPIALRWIKSGETIYVVTIQRQPGGNVNQYGPNDNFVLTIQSDADAPPLQISSVNDAALRHPLQRLYIEAQASTSDKTISILKDFLKGL